MNPEIPILLEWQEQRDIVSAGLTSLAELLDKHHNKVNKVGIAGSSMATGGATIGLAAMALAPFTGGASLIPGAVLAGGSSLVGTATTLGGYVSEKRKSKKVFKDVESLLEEDKRCTEEVQKVAARLEEVQNSLQKHFTDLVESEIMDLDQGTKLDDYCGDKASAGYAAHNMVPVRKPDRNADQLQNLLMAKLPVVASRGIQLARRANLLNIRRMFLFGKEMVKDGVRAGKGAVGMGRMVTIGGGVMTAVLLPFEIIDLVKRIKDLKEDKGHPDSAEIRQHVKKLQDGIEIVKTELYKNIREISNLVLLIHYIKQRGCSDKLSSFVNHILKLLLPAKDLIKAFDKLENCIGEKVTSVLDEEELSCLLINYTGVKDCMFKELAVTIWIAWKMGRKSLVLLQNTGFTEAPALWTLFGISVNTFGDNSEHGVSILLPFDFEGDIVSEHEFPETKKISDWNGRCVLLNISLMSTNFTLVNLLAPEGGTDRTLFLQETSSFIKKHARGRLIVAANFQPEVLNMTVLVKKKKVCPTVPWPVMKKFVPYRQVSEYLINTLPHPSDEPGMKVFDVCQTLSAGDPLEVYINWMGCDKPMVSQEDCSKQVKAILSLGLTALWKKLNSRITEFSSVTRVSRRVISCTMTQEFYVDCDTEREIKTCFLDHDLRFLEFLTEAVLQFGRQQTDQN